MRDAISLDDRPARLSRARLLRLSLLGFAGGAVLTAIGLLAHSAPASADEQPGAPSLLGSIVAPVTGVVDSTVGSIPVVGDTASALLGPTPVTSITAPVVGAVDDVVGGAVDVVTGGTAGTAPSTPPSTSGPGSSTGDGAATPGGDGGTVTAPAQGSDPVAAGPGATSTPVPAAAPLAAAAPDVVPAIPTATFRSTSGDVPVTPLAAPTAPSAQASAPAPAAPAPGPSLGGPVAAGGAVASSGFSASGPSGDVGASWTPPILSLALRYTAGDAPSHLPPPGEHEVSPG